MNNTELMSNKLLKYQEKYANNIFNNKPVTFLNFKIKSIKRRLTKSITASNLGSEIHKLNCLFETIDNDRTLRKYSSIFNKNRSLFSLSLYLKRRDKISTHYGYSNFNEALTAKLKLMFGNSFNFIDFCKNIVNICTRKIKSLPSNDKLVFFVDETELTNYLEKISPRLNKFYNCIKQNNRIFPNYTTFGALTIHFPISNKDYIMINDVHSNTDYLLHELGHIIYNKLKCNNPTLLLRYDLCDEIISSAIQYLYLNLGVSLDKKFLNIYREFLSRVQILALNIFFQLKIGYKNKLTNKSVNDLWHSLTHLLGIQVETTRPFSFDNYFNLNMSLAETTKYFIGKSIPILLEQQNCLSYDFITNFLTKACIANNLDFINKI